VLRYVALATEMTFSLLIKLLRQASVFLKCIDLPVKDDMQRFFGC